MNLDDIIQKYTDDRESLADEEFEFLLEKMREDKEILQQIKDQFVLDELLSRELADDRLYFLEQVRQRLKAEKDADKFQQATLIKAKKHIEGLLGANRLGYLIRSLNEVFRRSSWWLGSIAFHAVFMITVSFLVVFMPRQFEEKTVVIMDIQAIHGQGMRRISKMGIRHSELKISEHALNIQEPDIQKEEIFELDTPEDLERMHWSQNLKERVSIEDIKGETWFEEIGIGNGVPGMFINRTGINRRWAIARNGGSAGTESAVLAALRWFKRHQALDGSWSFETYDNQCTLASPCNKVIKQTTSKGLEEQGKLNCATAFGLLSFLGAGHTHKAGKFRQQVADGLSYLKHHQNADGSFSENNYAHAITAMAVAEAYGMTKSPSLKDMAQKSVDVILDRQKRYETWYYTKGHSGRNDSSVTGWCVLALKSAKSSGLDIGDSFEGVTNHLKHVTPEVQGGGRNSTLKDHVSYIWMSGAKTGNGHRNPRLTAIGMLCRVFIGEDTQGAMLRAHGNMMLNYLPQANKTDFYQMYYATLAMFQMGGEYWRKWNVVMKKILCDTQRKGGCADGSWDPTGFEAWADTRCGRVFFTAVGCLSLEVYYRYLPVAMLK